MHCKGVNDQTAVLQSNSYFYWIPRNRHDEMHSTLDCYLVIQKYKYSAVNDRTLWFSSSYKGVFPVRLRQLNLYCTKYSLHHTHVSKLVTSARSTADPKVYILKPVAESSPIRPCRKWRRASCPQPGLSANMELGRWSFQHRLQSHSSIPCGSCSNACGRRWTIAQVL